MGTVEDNTTSEANVKFELKHQFKMRCQYKLLDFRALSQLFPDVPRNASMCSLLRLAKKVYPPASQIVEDQKGHRLKLSASSPRLIDKNPELHRALVKLVYADFVDSNPLRV